jgi:hypothetical protein
MKPGSYKAHHIHELQQSKPPHHVKATKAEWRTNRNPLDQSPPPTAEDIARAKQLWENTIWVNRYTIHTHAQRLD